MCSSIAAWGLKACQSGSCLASSFQGPDGFIKNFCICRLLVAGWCFVGALTKAKPRTVSAAAEVVERFNV